MRECKRFNVLCCGRRWGKTTMATELLLEKNAALDGYPVSYFPPTYKIVMQVWREVILTCYPIIASKSEVEKRIELVTGGVIDFWSLEEPDAARGRKYKKVIIDEAAACKKLKYAWTKVIRPMLTDMKGEGWFLSTPNGKLNYFYDLFELPKTKNDWASWQMPSSTNPYIAQSEIDEAESLLDPVSFAQEYLASFVTDDLDSWAYSYNEDKHVGPTLLDRRYEVYLSFDFNKNPITCGVFQHHAGIRGIEQIKLKNSNIYSLCDYIKAKYNGCMFVVTGDATGKGSSALVQDNINYYTVIKAQLKLSQGQLKVPTVNPTLKENRVLVNSVLHNMDVLLDRDNCKGLLFDLEHAKVLPNGDLDKTDRKDPTKQLDALDCFRYYLNTFFKHILKF